jgi:hypothetical protein
MSCVTISHSFFLAVQDFEIRALCLQDRYPFFIVLVFLFLFVGEIAILGGIEEQNEKLWSFAKKASHIQLDR